MFYAQDAEAVAAAEAVALTAKAATAVAVAAAGEGSSSRRAKARAVRHCVSVDAPQICESCVALAGRPPLGSLSLHTYSTYSSPQQHV